MYFSYNNSAICSTIKLLCLSSFNRKLCHDFNVCMLHRTYARGLKGNKPQERNVLDYTSNSLPPHIL